MITTPLTFGSSLLQPNGFDNLVDSWGLGGLFGQTSFETISSEGQTIVENAFDTFQRQFEQNPGVALTTLSKELNLQQVRFELMIRNATSKRTKQGLPISLDAIKKGIVKLNTLITSLSSKYTINKVKKNEAFHFIITKPYSYYEFNLVPKTKTTSKVSAKSMFTETGEVIKTNNTTSNILLFGGVFLLVKTLFPKLLKF